LRTPIQPILGITDILRTTIRRSDKKYSCTNVRDTRGVGSDDTRGVGSDDTRGVGSDDTRGVGSDDSDHAGMPRLVGCPSWGLSQILILLL
jgi:hypothetical protein